jgi:hypothetical protein
VFYSCEEIELTLNLYSIAKTHLNELERYRIVNEKDYFLNCYQNYYLYYSHIIYLVDSWLNNLMPDEVQIVSFRVFNNESYDYIAGQLGYANHSSVTRKFKGIIYKLSHSEEVKCLK